MSNSKFIDILMVFPSGGSLHTSNFKWNLGSAYIIAYLQEKGFKAKQFVSNESYNVKECVEIIMGHRPKVVGFTVYETNYMQSILISKGLKKYNPNLIIIFGGPTPTVQSKEILEGNLSVDICVRGEGEEITLKLLSLFSDNNFNLVKISLDNIKGITYRKGRRIISNPDSNILLLNRFTKNYLDKYPSPYLSRVIPISEASQTGIITARGCNQNCIYCNCAVMSKRNIFCHSIERVIEELIFLNEYKGHSGPIPIQDDGFTIIPSRAQRICESIIDNKIELPLTCITRCDKITEDLLNLLKQAGFVSLGFSLESAVPRVLRTIGKVNPPKSKDSDNLEKEIEFIEKLKHMTAYAKKIGIRNIFVSVMIGLPGETIQDAQKTIDLIKQLDLSLYQHNFFRIFTGTPISQNYKEYGYIVKPIGSKNKIMTHNSFPFNIYEVKMAPNSTREKEYKAIDFNNLKILSMNTNRMIQKPYFSNIIINSDIIKRSLVNWIQENLVINGRIIQIYSNKKKYVKYRSKNLATLYNELIPTLYYECYYWDNIKDFSSLKSEKISLLGEQIGLTINFKHTNSALRSINMNNENLMNSICFDDSKTDTQALYDFLMEISNNENYFKDLLDSKPLPYFRNLCRWTKNVANCQTLDTAIITSDNSIRICWHSPPIGKIGNSMYDLIQKLQDLSKSVAEIRSCIECSQNVNCVKCKFPYPLSSTEYCELKKKSNTDYPAKIINSLNIFKDLLYDPITIIDF
ncbi:MAG: B12-binding domain-containing radical SAM protein [Promethearchaeota archaeon]